MQKLEIKYRTWYKGIAPRPIKLEIPGWAGDDRNHGNGAKPQPWHCPPFVEGSTYGLELIYPFDTECHVVNENGKVSFRGDFSQEEAACGMELPPFMSFAPDHYGFTSSLDLCPPEGYIVRTEPHPRYYTDNTGTVPLCVPGHLQGEWWTKIFFVVFKAPAPGQRHIFRSGEGYGQILVLPKKVSYTVVQMGEQEAHERNNLDQAVNHGASGIARHVWKDHLGHTFDDKYKVMRAAYEQGGMSAVKEVVNKGQQAVIDKEEVKRKKSVKVGKFVKVKKR